jgi:hypothetical protein
MLVLRGGSVACVDKTNMSSCMYACAYGRASALAMLITLDTTFLDATDVMGRTVRCAGFNTGLHSRLPLGFPLLRA